MEKLITATGKEFDCDYFNPFPPVRQVNLRVLNVDLVSVATVFSNPDETVLLCCGAQQAEQYTKLVAIVPEGSAIRVVLGKE
jgi:hypothetical protein